MTARASQPIKQRPQVAWFTLGGAAVLAGLMLIRFDTATHAWVPAAALLVWIHGQRRPIQTSEEALRRSDDRYRDLFDSAFDVVVLVSGDGDVVDINERGVKVTGWSRQELLRFNVLRDLVVEEDRALIRSLLADVVQGKERLYEVRWATKDGRVVAFEGATNAFLDRDGNFMWTRCTLRDITRRKELEEQLVNSTFYDALTGLPNRALLLDRLGDLLQRREAPGAGGHVAVLFVGLDQFAAVNDALGHETGDEILRMIGPRLHDVLDASDRLGRAGGDEFVIVREVDDVDAAVDLAEEVITELCKPFVVGADPVVVGASVGIALTGDDHPTTPALLLRNSHAALHRAKALGRGRWVVFAAEHQARADRLVRTRSDLHRAITHDELVVHYQPLVSATTGVPLGVEALVRWHHPTRGLLGPDQFIGVAEQTGLIVPLGEWILREAATTLSRWHSTRRELADIFVSVNVAADQLIDPGFAAKVDGICAGAGVHTGHLILEITETGLMVDPDAVERTLWTLRRLGVGIAVDDFGVGYSSLGYLRRFPIDKVKIDRSFIQGLPGDEQSLTIVKAITGMSQTLGMEVIAEGVEHGGQLDAVLACGCDIVQGYRFGRPAPAPDTEGELTRMTRRPRPAGPTDARWEFAPGSTTGTRHHDPRRHR